MIISHSDPKVICMGRTDVYANETKLYWAGSQAIVKFRGTRLSAAVNSTALWGNLRFGVITDGVMSGVPMVYENNGKDITVTLAEGLSDDIHTVVLDRKSVV